jgi:DNA-binding CsgD family transcriptional regulator
MSTQPQHSGFGGPQGGRAINGLSLDLRKKEVMKFLLEKNSLKEISLITGYSYQTIRNYCSDPEFQNDLRNYSKEIFEATMKDLGARNLIAAERINELSMKVLDRFEKIIAEGSDHNAIKAGQDILDRNVEVPRNRRYEGEVTQRVFDPAALMHAANVAEELNQARDNGPRTIDSQSEG